MNLDQKLKRLVASIQLLAADANVQLSAFPVGVCKADEIVLAFDECLVFLRELADANFISVDAKEEIQRVDEFVSNLGGKEASVWSDSAVRESPDWLELRRLAKATLKQMGEIQEVPKLDWMTFVPGANRVEDS